MIYIPIPRALKLELELEAWGQGLGLADYIRRILERSHTPAGKPRSWSKQKMGKPGRPREYRGAHRRLRARAERAAAAQQARQSGVE